MIDLLGRSWESMKGAVIGLLGKEQREFARRMHEVQGMGMTSVAGAENIR